MNNSTTVSNVMSRPEWDGTTPVFDEHEARIVALFKLGGQPLTRKQVSDVLGIPLASVVTVLKRGAFVECGATGSGRGRPAKLYALAGHVRKAPPEIR